MRFFSALFIFLIGSSAAWALDPSLEGDFSMVRDAYDRGDCFQVVGPARAIMKAAPKDPEVITLLVNAHLCLKKPLEAQRDIAQFRENGGSAGVAATLSKRIQRSLSVVTVTVAPKGDVLPENFVDDLNIQASGDAVVARTSQFQFEITSVAGDLSLHIQHQSPYVEKLEEALSLEAGKRTHLRLEPVINLGELHITLDGGEPAGEYQMVARAGTKTPIEMQAHPTLPNTYVAVLRPDDYTVQLKTEDPLVGSQAVTLTLAPGQKVMETVNVQRMTPAKLRVGDFDSRLKLTSILPDGRMMDFKPGSEVDTGAGPMTVSVSLPETDASTAQSFDYSYDATAPSSDLPLPSVIKVVLSNETVGLAAVPPEQTNGQMELIVPGTRPTATFAVSYDAIKTGDVTTWRLSNNDLPPYQAHQTWVSSRRLSRLTQISAIGAGVVAVSLGAGAFYFMNNAKDYAAQSRDIDSMSEGAKYKSLKQDAEENISTANLLLPLAVIGTGGALGLGGFSVLKGRQSSAAKTKFESSLNQTYPLSAPSQ